MFELQVEEKDGNQTGYVPYMMNDAIECYLSFHGLRISGKYDKDYEGEMWAQLEEREGRYGLIVHQGEESVFTMWFDEIMEHTNCYRYHEIGHFWREGAEQWRQLVYMIGTIREKYRFLGEVSAEIAGGEPGEEPISIQGVMDCLFFEGEEMVL